MLEGTDSDRWIKFGSEGKNDLLALFTCKILNSVVCFIWTPQCCCVPELNHDYLVGLATGIQVKYPGPKFYFMFGVLLILVLIEC